VSARSLGRLLTAWAVAMLVLCVAIERSVVLHGLDASSGPSREIVASVWSGGKLVERAILSDANASDPKLAEALARDRAAELVHEIIEDEGPILFHPELALAFSLVSGRDGLKVTLDGKTIHISPDDLLVRQAYDRGLSIEGLSLAVGTDVPLVLALAAERLHTTARRVLDGAHVRRIRVARVHPSRPPPPVINASTLTREMVHDAAVDAARYLARGVDGEGRFRYTVDAPTNRTVAGYDWPRHAGATYFLAQAAALTKDPDISFAALRAASLLRDKALERCGDDACVAHDNMAEIGSSALAVIAFAEIARTGLDPTYRTAVVELARFLRAQQRPDGEFMHQYDRQARRRVDVQFLYFSGEASLGLARAFALTGDPADRDAAARGLHRLVTGAWSFFGDHYYYGEEHWTCQAMDDLWESAPDRDALDFCLRWQAYGRKLQHVNGDSPYDAEGAYSPDPVITPRLTPVASRSEAAVSTLDAATRAHAGDADRRAIDLQLRRSLALLVKKQFRPGPSHLFADPVAVRGAIPGSEVDWQLRIDYAQHAGSAMIRWLAVTP
jgi:hypothetical protein